jgi:hypothetical protein
MPESAEPPRVTDSPKKFLDVKANLRSLIGAVILAIFVWGGYSLFVATNSDSLPNPAGRPRTISEVVGRAVRPPQVLVDEDWVIDAGGLRFVTATLPDARPVSVTYEGGRDSGKGFSVYRVNADQLALLKSRKSFSYDPQFSREKVKSFKFSGTVPQGATAFVVVNSENLLKSMSVRVRIVIDPE